jgi:hypothetical protein
MIKTGSIRNWQRLSTLGATSKSGAAPVLEQIGEFHSGRKQTKGWVWTPVTSIAVDNYIIGKYDKETGKLLKKVGRAPKAALSCTSTARLLMDGKLYAAHSNYPEWPMTSSLEIFDAETYGAHRHPQLRYPVGLAYMGGLVRQSLVDDLRELRPPVWPGKTPYGTQG